MSTRIEGAGAELELTVAGSGPALLLVHDIAADARDFGDLLEAAGDDLRMIAYDRRGYGASGAPEPYERTTVREQAEDARVLLQTLDAAPALALGRGFGALIVLDLLVRLPGLVRGAVLIDPPLHQLSDASTAALSQQRELLEAALRDGGPAAALGAWRPDADARLRAAHRAFFADYAGLASWPLTRAELRAIAVPVTVLTGPDTPGHIAEAADKLTVLIGHAAREHGEDPLAALRALL